MTLDPHQYGTVHTFGAAPEVALGVVILLHGRGGFAQMVAGIDVILFRPDAELRRLARLALETGADAAFVEGRILLVREASDGSWALPGGWADVNDSPAEAAMREVLEESGFEARAVKLAADPSLATDFD